MNNEFVKLTKDIELLEAVINDSYDDTIRIEQIDAMQRLLVETLDEKNKKLAEIIAEKKQYEESDGKRCEYSIKHDIRKKRMTLGCLAQTCGYLFNRPEEDLKEIGKKIIYLLPELAEELYMCVEELEDLRDAEEERRTKELVEEYKKAARKDKN